MINRDTQGFSLIEVMVSAAIIGLSLFAVITMVRKGQEQLMLNNHRNEARGIIQRTIENPRFDPEQYKSLVTTTSPTPQDVVIDGKASLHGSLTVTINAEQNQAGINPLLLIPYREIIITISWTELSSGNSTYTETVSERKRLCNVQRE
jgi:prepilin-type N-terminal cleavage/methylation domain-containing protein